MTDNTNQLEAVQAQMNALHPAIVTLTRTNEDMMSVEMDNIIDQWQALYQLKLSLLQAA
jgi:hypothetical protein